VANRIGIARSEDPEVVERQLSAALPPKVWTLTSDTLILHGRRICRPRPLCDRCAVRGDCDFVRQGGGTSLLRASRSTSPPAKTAPGRRTAGTSTPPRRRGSR
jgi:adenine-specific DNA glycosylase